MNNRSDKPTSVDERLADYTDRLLAGDIPQEADLRDSGIELNQLQETIKRIRNAFPAKNPDPAMQNRIRINLTSELRKNKPEIGNVSRTSRVPRRTLQWSFAIGATIILVSILVFVPSGDLTIPGTAGINTDLIWIPIGIVLLIIAGLIFWQVRKK